MGTLRTETKFDLMPCLGDLVRVRDDLSTLKVQANILDGVASSTCCDQGLQRHWEVVTDVFVPYVISQLQQSACRQIRHCRGSVHGRQLEVEHLLQERKGS